MDPAGVFNLMNDNQRIHKGDAKYVQVNDFIFNSV